MSVSHKVRDLVWKRDTSWRELVIIAAVIIFVIALIGAVR